MPSGGILENLAGREFNDLTVISFIGFGSSHKAVWECLCKCGNTIKVKANSLKTGNTKSCGCRLKPHGRSGTPEHNAWLSMLKRCYTDTTASFSIYGARGIKVCERWRESFVNFFADMGPRPSSQHSLDRIDNNGDYEPQNCRWATRSEQMINRRMTPLITHDGLTLSAAEWSSRTGLCRKIISLRIRKGWTVHDALTTPLRPKRKVVPVEDVVKTGLVRP